MKCNKRAILCIAFASAMILPSPSYAQSQVNKSVNVSFSFGGGQNGQSRFTVYGYTSPRSPVWMDGMGIHDKAYSKDNGYFEFHELYTPSTSREVCFYSQDQEKRITASSCIPPFPVDYNTNIGPIVLAPTISLNSNDYFVGDEVVLSGQTVPNTQIQLSFFGDDQNGALPDKIARTFEIVKPVEAFTLPQLQTEADKNGKYTFSLPSSIAYSYRIFVQTTYDNNSSPKSNTLHFDIFPIWLVIIRWFLFFLEALRQSWLLIMINAEVVIVITYLFLLIKRRLKHNKRTYVPYRESKYPLAIRDPMDLSPIVEETEIEVYHSSSSTSQK